MMNQVSPAPDYRALAETLYEDVMDPNQVGRFRAWYHASRFRAVTNTVGELFRPGMTTVDVACGNSSWNSRKIPLVGIDIHDALLRRAILAGRASSGAIVDVANAELCFAASSVDLAICSEALEHFRNYPAVLREIHRVLKPGGQLIVTVPFDRPGTPFWLLFNLFCLFRGYVLNQPYYRSFCGHVNHFSRKAVAAALTDSGFRVEQQFVHKSFIIFSVVTKPASS